MWKLRLSLLCLVLGGCWGAPFTMATSVDVGAGDAGGEVPELDAAQVDAGDVAELAPDAGNDVLELRDAGDAAELRDGPEKPVDAAADVAGDVLEHDAPADVVTITCNPSACAACSAGELPCCMASGGCGCALLSVCR